MSSGRKRIDVLLVERGLAPSRERAQSLILAGQVLCDDVPVTKAGQQVLVAAQIRVRGEDHPYVSRGGLKLAAALDGFKLDVSDRVGLDVGASTGGFTHVLLLRGATRVHAVDVGHNQLDWRLRTDSRVHVREKVNAREMGFEVVGEKVGIIVADLSFISLEKVLPNLRQFAGSETDWVTLFKPQFEVGRESVGKGGIVTDEAARENAFQRVVASLGEQGFTCLGRMDSPIRGTEGNVEYLVHWRFSP
jgi:23S rRNA (cytidine1920-2'-O)/16S rRNA (cytidine1409-2'-O)-methyltransferase